MVRPLMTDTVFLARKKALPADAGDITVADDLLDTLKAHEDGCVGMAANMIGVNKAIIVFNGRHTLRDVQPGHRLPQGAVPGRGRLVRCRGSAGPGGTAPLRCSGRIVDADPRTNFTGWTAPAA